MANEIGPLLRGARIKRSISLRRLAAEIGVSPSLISQVETGKTQPSVSTLYSLTNYLGLSIDDLLASESSIEVPSIPSSEPQQFHAASQPAVQRGHENPRLDMDNGVRWERLAIGEGGPTEPLLVTYSPGASSSIEGKLMRHGGYEYAYILEGELTLRLEFDTYVLSAGDSLQFDSQRPHMYTNDGSKVARGVWHIVGRRQQNQSLPTAPASTYAISRDRPELASAVDVLKAMENVSS